MSAARPVILDSVPSRRASALVWIAAALGALALHAGGIAFALNRMQPEDDDVLGAPAMEVSLDFTAPRVEPTDLPPGPEAEESVASPPVVEQKEEVKESDLPKDTPTDTEDPDRLVSPDAAKKPDEDHPKTPTVEARPSVESAASEATAPPTSEVAVEAPRSAAPSPGTGDSARRVRMTWQRQLIAHLDRHKRYPAGAARHGVEVTVKFTLDRLGHVLTAVILKGSGDPSFDEAALAMMRRSDPVPPPPPLVADEGLDFTLPVIFRAGARN